MPGSAEPASSVLAWTPKRERPELRSVSSNEDRPATRRHPAGFFMYGNILAAHRV